MAEPIVIPIIGKDEASAALKAVRGQVVDLGKDAQDTGGILGKLGDAVAGLGGVVLKAGLAVATTAVIGFGAALAGGVKDAREHALVMAQTQQTIESMGNAAGVSAEHVEDFAASLSAASGKSLFGDDEIQAATNMLLTFGNIKGATLDLATTLTVDMAQALHKTPQDMSIMVGKILNSADAMSAAQRQGVSFTDAQLKLGKRLFETGHIAEYQKLVLDELNKEFGGQAAAAAKADGGWAQLHDRLGEAAETMGTAVLPLLNGLAGVLNDRVLPVVENAAGRFADLIAAFQTGAEGGDFIGGLTNALYSLDDVSPVFDTIADGINIIAGLADDAFGEGGGIGVLLDDIREMTGIDLGPLVGTFQDVARAAQGLYDIFFNRDFTGGIFGLQEDDPIIGTLFDLRDAITGLIADTTATFSDAANPIEGFLAVLSEVSPAFALLSGVAQETLPQTLAIVESVFGNILAFVQTNGAEMVGQALTTWQTLHDSVLGIISPLAGLVNAILDQISVFWQAHGQEILAFVGETWTQVNGIIQTALQLLSGIIQGILIVITEFIQAHGNDIQNILSNAWTIISNIISGALEIIQGLLSAALAVFRGDWQGAWTTIQDMSVSVTQKIWEVIKAALDLIANLFGTTLQGIADTWSSNWRNLQSLADTAVAGLVNLIMGLPGQVAGVGEAVVNMIWNGLRAKWHELEAWFSDQLQGLRNQLPFSEPKDTSSPLYGLSKSGESIIEQILVGLQARGGDLAAALGDDLGTVQKELRATLTGVGADVYDTTDSFREMLQSLGLTWEQTNAADDALHNLGATLQDTGPDSQDTADAFDSLMRTLGLGGEAADQLRSQIAQLAGVATDTAQSITDSSEQIMQSLVDDVGAALEQNSLPETAEELGNNIWGGLLEGMENRFGDVLDQFGEWNDQLEQKFADAWDTHSPSGVTEDLGNNILLGLLAGMDALMPDLIDQIGSMSDDMLGEIEQLSDKVHGALADAFDATADIADQQAKNITAVRRLTQGMQAETQGLLDQALAESQQYQDPEQAAKYYKMRSDQILKLAKLQGDYQAAVNAGDTQQISDLQEQISLAEKAQTAQRAAFATRQQGGSHIGQLADQIQKLLLNEDLPGAIDDPSGLVQRLFDFMTHLQGIASPGSAPALPGQGGAAAGLPPMQGMMAANGGSIFGRESIVVYQAPGQSTDQFVDVLFEKIRQRSGGRF